MTSRPTPGCCSVWRWGRSSGQICLENVPSVLPISWCIERGPMRTFYTVLGHFVTAYEDGKYMQHLRGAVEWVLG